MLHSIVRKFQYGNNIITLETGIIARQATASVMASMNDTSVLVTVVVDKKVKNGQNFFPLNVNYQERSYSVGKFPGSFFRREGRPSESEILISRLIDRPIRPLFPKNFLHEVQIIATAVSVDPQINPDIIAIIGASTVLTLSGIPFFGPIGAARVGYINGNYILNPTQNELNESSLDLVVSRTKKTILMVESEAKFLNENQMLNAIKYGFEKQKVVIDNINQLKLEAGKPKWKWNEIDTDISLKFKISKLSESRLINAYSIIDKQERISIIDTIKADIIKNILNKDSSLDQEKIENIFSEVEKELIRNHILSKNLRIDGRKKDTIRNLDVRTGILPRTHGSALFTRGETQALVSVTLGTERDAQNIDELSGDRVDRFLLHYNFPPYCVGETGIVGSPKRREIGHGRLAKRGILAVMPNAEEFPYTVRVVSEITESNGSSSMASICGASLALMDAGVPIKSSVAGVAMGLIKEGEKFIILSDILGDEDHIGDMDFKVAGNKDGITALQMDIKVEGISHEIMSIALNQAKNARIQVLNVMDNLICKPRNDISILAPRIYTIKINPEKIKDVIGKGGSVIRALIEQTGTIIEIEDNGIVKIAATDKNKAQKAISKIEEITADIEIGRIYYGKVIRITDFGAFISIINNKEGLVHISQISNKRIEKVSDYLEIGQKVPVKVIEIDRYGRIRLSIKESVALNKIIF